MSRTTYRTAGWLIGLAAVLVTGISGITFAADMNSGGMEQTSSSQDQQDGTMPQTGYQPQATQLDPVTSQPMLIPGGAGSQGEPVIAPPQTFGGYQQHGVQLNPSASTQNLKDASPLAGSYSVEGEQGNVRVLGNVTPQGPDLAQGLPQAQGLVAYKPIDESRLPKGATTGTPASTAAQASLPMATNLGAPAINWGPYTLGPDDVVHIAVRNQREFTGVYAIGRDGKIQFGFIGDIDANGLTKEQLAERLEETLKRYVRMPQVNVTIIGFNSKAIYILGRVARPGKYAMRGDSIKIRDAVIAAGLMVQHAKLRRVHIVKSDPNNPHAQIIDLQEVLYKGKMEENVDLVHGDIVVIPTTVWGGISDFLSSLLSPAGHAGSVAALAAL